MDKRPQVCDEANQAINIQLGDGECNKKKYNIKSHMVVI